MYLFAIMVGTLLIAFAQRAAFQARQAKRAFVERPGDLVFDRSSATEGPPTIERYVYEPDFMLER
jgi:hypothetical protein